LPHFRTLQLFFEFGLANQDDLQEFFRRCLQIQQQAYFLQQFEGEALGFIDNQNRVGAFMEARDKPLIELQQHVADEAEIRGDAEIVEDEIEEMIGLQMGIEDEGCGRLPLAQPIEEVIDQGGLACTDFAGEEEKAFTLLNTVGQLVQSFLNAGGLVQKTRVGVDVERIFAKSKEIFVHGCVITTPSVVLA
jgi:hypothetical protein